MMFSSSQLSLVISFFAYFAATSAIAVRNVRSLAETNGTLSKRYLPYVETWQVQGVSGNLPFSEVTCEGLSNCATAVTEAVYTALNAFVNMESGQIYTGEWGTYVGVDESSNGIYATMIFRIDDAAPCFDFTFASYQNPSMVIDMAEYIVEAMNDANSIMICADFYSNDSADGSWWGMTAFVLGWNGQAYNFYDGQTEDIVNSC